MFIFFESHDTHKLVDSDYTIVSDSYHCVTLEQWVSWSYDCGKTYYYYIAENFAVHFEYCANINLCAEASLTKYA